LAWRIIVHYSAKALQPSIHKKKITVPSKNAVYKSISTIIDQKKKKEKKKTLGAGYDTGASQKCK